MFQPVRIAKGGLADGFKDRDILEPDLNNSNLSNGTWSLAVEMMDKAREHVRNGKYDGVERFFAEHGD